MHIVDRAIATIDYHNGNGQVATVTGASLGVAGGMAVVGGLLAAPFTGGASLAVIGAGAATSLVGAGT